MFWGSCAIFEHLALRINFRVTLSPSLTAFICKWISVVILIFVMEDGGVDRIIIDCRQNQLGQMVDIPPLLTFLIFDL